MPREIPYPDRRLAEEAVRRGMAAAVVMEAAAREWVGLEGGESFPEWLSGRSVLSAEQVAELRTALAGEFEAAPGEVLPEGAAPRAPHPSEVIKGYRILERLGRGGMGSVYRAEQMGMNRTVALKILRRPLGAIEEHVERLKREARLVGALDHPNIVRGLDVGQHGPYHYFAMEFVEGETLRDLLKRRGVVPEAEALRIVEEVCLALDHAHSRGVIHRDVKPGNIMITPEGTAKLTDYGLAKGPADFSLTQSGVTIGTPQYISPEQAHDPAGVDIQTDLYALGATAYHMLTGVPPHTSDTLAGLLTKVLYEKPRTARQVNPKVTAGASFLAEKMMAKQKRHRYRSPREVLRDLRSLKAGKSIVPRNWAGDFEVHEARRKLHQVVAGAAATVAAAAGLMVFLQYQAERKLREKTEENASLEFRRIAEVENPRSKAGWEDLGEALAAFVRNKDYAGTKAARDARGEIERVEDHLHEWRRAESVENQATTLWQAGRCNEAVEAIERELPSFARPQVKAPGRDPSRWLGEVKERIRAKGLEAAERHAKKALEDADAVGDARGAAEVVERNLEAARAEILARMVPGDDSPPARDLQEVLERIRRARSRIEGSCLGEGYRAEAEKALTAGDFARVEGLLRAAQRRLDEDALLQDLLRRIPRPAADDLRRLVESRRTALEERNREALTEARRKAREWEAQGEADRAIALLEDLEEKSVEGLQEEIAADRKVVVDNRDRAAAESARQIQELWEGVFADLAKRDYFGARKRVEGGVPGAGVGAAGRRTAEAALSVQLLLSCIEREAFEPVRKAVKEGRPLPLGRLRFEGGNRQPYAKAANLRLEETPTGTIIVFDEPGQPGLRGALHNLSLEVLFLYAGLAADGLPAEKELAKSALFLAEGGAPEIARFRIEAEQTRLRRIRETLPAPAGAAVDALLDRAAALAAQKLRLEANREETAAKYHNEAIQALQARNPWEAQRNFELLLKSLGNTQFVIQRLPTIRLQLEQAMAMMKEDSLEKYYLAKVVDPSPGNPEPESLTRMKWSFDLRDQLKGFVLPEDGGQALYDVRLEDVVGNGGGKNGRLLFLGPEPGKGPGAEGRGIQDSPLVFECPFKPSRYISVSFQYRSEEPLYLQVSIVGNHVGVLTDDGRATGGRGVFAWQDDDWRNADQWFPAEYRHDYVAKQDLSKWLKEGRMRYFQFEPERTYQVTAVWRPGSMQLFVDGVEVWRAEGLDKGQRDKPPRVRIVTYTRCWIDDLTVEGVVDANYFHNKLLKKR